MKNQAHNIMQEIQKREFYISIKNNRIPLIHSLKILNMTVEGICVSHSESHVKVIECNLN